MKVKRRLLRLYRPLMTLLAVVLGAVVRLWARSCRVRIVHDPRPALRAANISYVYALLHEHQIAAVLANDEPQMAAMVSRSTDGDMLVPALRARRVQAVRGSGRRGTANKGGETALRALIRLNRTGVPVLLAVDGPRGPRGTVHGGVVALARASGAVVLPVAVLARRAWVLRDTWDHTQVPWPGTSLQLRFAAPIAVPRHAQDEDARQRIAAALVALQPSA